jgi:hypothetical protein
MSVLLQLLSLTAAMSMGMAAAGATSVQQDFDRANIFMSKKEATTYFKGNLRRRLVTWGNGGAYSGRSGCVSVINTCL